MKFVKEVAALALAIGTFTTAETSHAAVMTHNYTVTSTFATGPRPLVTTNFDLTYDAATNFNGSIVVSNFRSTGGTPFSDAAANQIFNVTVGPSQCSSGPSGMFFCMPGTTTVQRRVEVYGNLNGTNAFLMTDDFNMLFANDSDGNLTPVSVTYTSAVNDIRYSASSSTVVRVTQAAAGVPEPASWATMIGGLGAVGGAMRRRRRFGRPATA